MRAIPSIFLVVLAAALSACQQQPSASDIARQFWDAQLAGDKEAARAVALPGPLDRFNIQGVSVENFKIDTGAALERNGQTVVASSMQLSDGPVIAFDTVMASTQEGWRVDVAATQNDMLRGSVNAVFQELGNAFGQAAQNFGGDMEGINKELEQGLEVFGQQLQQAISKELQQLADELNPSPAPQQSNPTPPAGQPNNQIPQQL